MSEFSVFTENSILLLTFLFFLIVTILIPFELAKFFLHKKTPDGLVFALPYLLACILALHFVVGIHQRNQSSWEMVIGPTKYDLLDFSVSFLLPYGSGFIAIYSLFLFFLYCSENRSVSEKE